MRFAEERAAVVAACQRLVREKLVVGTAGNVSVRSGDHVIISPSGMSYDELKPEHVPVTDMNGALLEGDYAPSSELGLHLAIYTTSSHSAIVHTHAVASTSLSCVVDRVPLSHYYSALFGGAIRVAPYATYGSAELAANVQTAMSQRSAALMSNHGAVLAGSQLTKVMEQVAYLEYVCEVHLRALASGQPVKTISQDDLNVVINSLSNYGQSAR